MSVATQVAKSELRTTAANIGRSINPNKLAKGLNFRTDDGVLNKNEACRLVFMDMGTNISDYAVSEELKRRYGARFSPISPDTIRGARTEFRQANGNKDVLPRTEAWARIAGGNLPKNGERWPEHSKPGGIKEEETTETVVNSAETTQPMTMPVNRFDMAYSVMADLGTEASYDDALNLANQRYGDAGTFSETLWRSAKTKLKAENGGKETLPKAGYEKSNTSSTATTVSTTSNASHETTNRSSDREKHVENAQTVTHPDEEEHMNTTVNASSSNQTQMPNNPAPSDEVPTFGPQILFPPRPATASAASYSPPHYHPEARSTAPQMKQFDLLTLSRIMADLTIIMRQVGGPNELIRLIGDMQKIGFNWGQPSNK